MTSVPHAVVPYDPFAAEVDTADWPWVDVRDYGAVAGGSVDCTSAFQAAVDVSGAHRVMIPAGTYLITDTVTISQSRVQIVGEGQQISVVNFVPTSGGKPAFTFSSGAAVHYESALRDIAISSTDSTYQKIGIRLEDTSKFLLENVATGPQFHGPGLLGAGTSIGLQIRGRELGVVRNVTIGSDQPISIESNPNTAQILDLDLWHFEDVYTLSTGANPTWKFASGIQVTDFILDGANAGTDNGLSLGTGTGDYIYWVDGAPAPAASSFGFTVKNLRFEGATGGTAFIANIKKAFTTLRGVLFEDCNTGSGALNKGWNLRGVADVTLVNCAYQGTAEAFNADGANCDNIQFTNCNFLAASTITMTSLRLHRGSGRPSDATVPIGADELWVSSGYYGWRMNGNTLQSTVLLITNDTGTIKHSMFGSSSDSGLLGNYMNTINGASVTQAATPLVSNVVGFTSGGGIQASTPSRFIFDTPAAQVNADDYGIATIELNSSTVDLVVRLGNVSSDVNGVTRNRPSLVFSNATTGALYDLTTLGAGLSIRVKILAAIK